MLIPLILAGLAIGAIIMASNKGKGGVYNILIQSPTPIPSSAAMMGGILGFDPNGVNSIGISYPAQGSTVLTVAFRNDYSPSLPRIGAMVNFNGVPGTIRSVQRAPVSSGS